MQSDKDHQAERHGAGAPPQALVAAWAARDPATFPPTARWRSLSGGRTNAVWEVTGGARALVVKLYRADAATPLFANDPDAESASLLALKGTGLGPDLVDSLETPAGRSLCYVHVPGRPWRSEDDPGPVARALARLHAMPAPTGVPRLAMGVDRLKRETRDICEAVGPLAAEIGAQAPARDPVAPAPHPSFIHGDATAANTLVTPGGITFIDWQCPAVGDPADDLAVFLSPAMQIVSGNAVLTRDAEARFLDAYAAAAPAGDDTVARYRAQAPFYHARMAAYALWRAARGDLEYQSAARAELDRLKEAG